MAQLIVRKVDRSIAESLKARARSHGISAEEEHRRILKRALSSKGDCGSFKEFLQTIPNVGDDADFERIPQPDRKVEL